MEEMNSIVTSFNKEKQEIIYHTNNENNYKVIQEICRLYIDRSSMTKEIKRLNSIIKEVRETLEININEHNYDGASISALEILDKVEEK